MISDKVQSAFGDELPDRSTFRSKEPLLFREIIKQYKSWGKFVLSYSTRTVEKEEVVIPTVSKPEKKLYEAKKPALRS